MLCSRPHKRIETKVGVYLKGRKKKKLKPIKFCIHGSISNTNNTCKKPSASHNIMTARESYDPAGHVRKIKYCTYIYKARCSTHNKLFIQYKGSVNEEDCCDDEWRRYNVRWARALSRRGGVEFA